jgi:uncharacterized protein (DUF427 family)
MSGPASDRQSRPEPEPADGIAPNGLPRESVWDYPRPPAIRREPRPVAVSFAGETIADSRRALKVCETAGPPVVYVPPQDIEHGALVPAQGQTYCEWKGSASYYDVVAGGHLAERAAWSYHQPIAGFEPIRGYVAFYPALVECRLGEERVEPQPGQFYGGWVTAEITGPFKGTPGSAGW